MNSFSHSHNTLESYCSDSGLDLCEGGNPHKYKRPKTKRDKGLKYFNKVGYTKERLKAIPRWCTDMQLLDRMVIY